MKSVYSIGDLALVASTKVETIRYYEKIGLMPSAARTAGTHRAYSVAHRDRLAFIRHARELGFPLGDIRALLDFSDRPMRRARMPTASLGTTLRAFAVVSRDCRHWSPSWRE